MQVDISESMDPETARLVLQLQLDDLQTLTDTTKGKQPEGTIDDFELALNLYKAELESTSETFADKHMSQSIANAVREDGELINRWVAEESRAAADRSLAWQLETGTTPTNDNVTTELSTAGTNVDIEDELVDKLAALFVFGAGLEDDDEPRGESEGAGRQVVPESSAWAASRSKSGHQGHTRRCVSCLECFPFWDVARAPCSHEYCRGCLADLFSHSLTDESLFPPRCCNQAIPAEKNRLFLSAKQIGEFLAKKTELETPNRTYCHRPGCSTFIPEQFIQADAARGICPRCEERTCVICKGALHFGECPEDEGVQAVLRVAAENEWQRCYSCHTLVELQSGCHHISKSEFQVPHSLFVAVDLC